jgi:hypothetical protein
MDIEINSTPLEGGMFTRITKWLSACLASLVLVSFVGCGEDKGPTRTVDDTKEQEKKPAGYR